MGGPLHRLPATRGARAMTDVPARRAARQPRGHPRRGRAARGHHAADPAGRVRCRVGAALPQGRVAPADRGIQAARRLRDHRIAVARRTRSWGHHLFVGQPRAGRRARGSAARGTGRGRDAVRRAGREARTGRPRRRPDRDRRDGQRRAPPRGPGDRRGARASRSSRHSTMTGSSPARARSGSRSPRTSRTSRWSWCRSAVAGWRAASRSPSGRSGPMRG